MYLRLSKFMFICLVYRLLLFKQNASFHARSTHFGSFLSSSGDKFSTRGTRKAIAKSRRLWLQRCFIRMHILNMITGSLHTGSFRGVHSPFLDTDELKKRFTDPTSFRGFRETGPRIHARVVKSWATCETRASLDCLQLFRERLFYKRGNAYATMSKVIMGNGGFYGCLSEPQCVSAWWKETAQTRIHFFSFLVAESPWSSIKQSQTLTTHNANRLCHVRFYTFVGQPLSKQLYGITD